MCPLRTSLPISLNPLAAYQHPSESNPFQRYRQAVRLLRTTTRASNKAWYQDAHELDFQLHLRSDGTRLDSWYHDRRTGDWTPGPVWDEALVTDAATATALAREAIARAKAAKAPGIGIVLHVADEFATAEIKPEFDNPGALNELRQKIQDEPFQVLDDTSLSENDFSWRLIPYPASGSDAIATSVTLSRRYAAMLGTFRRAGEEANFPVITRALSAPLIALLGIPAQLGHLHPTVAPTSAPADERSPQEADGSAPASSQTATRSILAILPYPRFTLLAFFNGHGDLRLLRTLQHRGQRGPTNLRHVIATTSAALELADPLTLVLPVQRELDPQFLAALNAASPHQENGDVPLECRLVAEGIPNDLPLANSHTFTVLREDGWATQDFLPVPREEAERYPTSSEMRLLRISRYARLGMGAAALAALAWVGLQLVSMMRQPEWAFHLEESAALSQRMKAMSGIKTQAEHWENLLEDRSKAWANMELLSLLFPTGGNMMAKSFQHTAKTETAQAQAKTGFVKEWKISGLARDEALERLSNLNTSEGIGAIFEEIYRITGNAAFQTDLPSRTIVVNIRTLENSGFKPTAIIDEFSDSDESTYPYSFELTITQRFESTDPMAVLAAAAP